MLHKFTNQAITLVLTILVSSYITSSIAGDVQHLEPAKPQHYFTEGETYVMPSVTEPLKSGARVKVPDFGEPGKWYVQRLTDRSFWMISNAFALTAFVGDEGVLLIDSPDSTVPDDLFAALKTFTDLPVTAIAYSHPHVDHIGGSLQIKRSLVKQGKSLRVIGSASANKELLRYNNDMLVPTEIVADGRSTFMFEKWRFKLTTPVGGSAHSDGDSYILTPDGVIHYADFNYPGRLPLAYISSSRNISGWIYFLRNVLGEDWQFANLGHANVGYKRDIELTFAYLQDMYEAYFTLVAPGWADGSAFKETGVEPDWTAGVFWGNYADMSAEKMAMAVYPRWKQYPHSEVMRSQAYKVFEDAFVNYYYKGDDSIRPIFSPISPNDIE